MATFTFTGDATASNGTSLAVVQGIYDVYGYSSSDGRMNRFNADSDGSGATYRYAVFDLVADVSGQQLITGLTVYAGSSGGGYPAILAGSGLRQAFPITPENAFTGEVDDDVVNTKPSAPTCHDGFRA